MATPKVSLKLPPPNDHHSPDDHMKMSRRFIQLARIELGQGRRRQASEKAWGGLAQAAKAIGAQRGWKHRSHGLMYDIVTQVGAERGRPDFVQQFNAVESHHCNFYNTYKYAEDIRRTIDTVARLVDALDQIRQAEELPYKVVTPDAQTRLHKLTGKRPRIGEESPNGFVVERFRWRDNGNQGAASNIQQRPGNPTNGAGSAGRGAKPRRRRRSRNKKGNGNPREVNIQLG